MIKRLRPDTMTPADAAGMRTKLAMLKENMKAHIASCKTIGERVAATAQKMGEVQALLDGYAEVTAQRKRERAAKKSP